MKKNKDRDFNFKATLLKVFITLFFTFGILSCDIAENEEAKGSLKLKITENVSRTLSPDLSMDVVSYKIVGSGPDSASFEETSTEPSITVGSLVYGEWSLSVTALNKDGVNIGLGSGVVVIKGNDISELTVEVTPLSGNGSLNLTLNWVESDVTSPTIVASLLPAVGEKKVIDFVVNGASATYSDTTLKNGYYTLSVQLLDNGKLATGTVETVRIVSDHTTKGVFNFDDIKVTVATITTNIEILMDNPIIVSITGGAEAKEKHETITLSASVIDFPDNVTYVWDVNGTSKGTDTTFVFDDSWSIGSYNISVSAYSTDGSRAGSKTISIINEKPRHKIFFDSNGGSGTMDPLIVQEDSSELLSSNTFIKEGFKFSGWNTSQDGTGTPYIESDSYTMGVSDVTLYAQWEVIYFVTKWDVSENRLRIPFSMLNCDLDIDWGDGKTEHVTKLSQYYDDNRPVNFIEHIYSENGEYTVSISGVCNGFGYSGLFLGNIKENGYLIDVLDWGAAKLRNGGDQFFYCEKLTGFSATTTPDTSNVTDMSYMFYYAKLFVGGVSDWDTSNVTNMRCMFSTTESFNEDLSDWDTSNVTNMSCLFSSTTGFNGDISGWDTSSVTDMSSMFWGAERFNRDLSNWDTSNVTDMGYMFRDAINFNENISGWDTSNVTTMRDMFYRAKEFNIDISGWKTPKVKNLNEMFYNATAFNCGGIDLSSWEWDVSKVEAMTDIFSGTNIDTSQISWYKE